MLDEEADEYYDALDPDWSIEYDFVDGTQLDGIARPTGEADDYVYRDIVPDVGVYVDDGDALWVDGVRVA